MCIRDRYRTSQYDGSFSGSYTAIAESDSVVCSTPAASAAQTNSCSSGDDNITITLDNRNQLASYHFKVEYSTDGGTTWSTGDNGLSDKTVGSDTLTTVALKSSADLSHGTTVKIRYYTSLTDDFSGANSSTPVELSDITISCPVFAPSASAAVGLSLIHI